jgi:4-hydroxybenzoate polyprenyltransferase
MSVFIIVIGWLLAPDAWKNHSRMFYAGVAAGFGCLLAVIYSLVSAPIDFVGVSDEVKLISVSRAAAELQALIALVGLVGFAAGLLRLTKDFFGLKLDEYSERMGDAALYDSPAACTILLLIVNLLLCVLLALGWFLVAQIGPSTLFEGAARPRFLNNLMAAGLASNVLALLAVVLTFAIPGRLKKVIEQCRGIAKMSPNPGQQTSGTPLTATKPATASRTARILFGACETARLGVSVVAGAAAALPFLFAGNAGYREALASFFCWTAITACGFFLNDVYDLEKDKIAQKSRPITLGTLSVDEALVGAAALCGTSFLLSWWAFGALAACFLLVVIAALGFYSPFSRRVPLLKGVYTAVLCLAPVVFGFTMSSGAASYAAIGALGVYIVGREIVLDGHDSVSDFQSGLKTTAYYMGAWSSRAVGWTAMFAALLFGFLFIGGSISMIALTAALILQCISLYVHFLNEDRGITMTRGSMLLGVLAVCANA